MELNIDVEKIIEGFQPNYRNYRNSKGYTDINIYGGTEGQRESVRKSIECKLHPKVLCHFFLSESPIESFKSFTGLNRKFYPVCLDNTNTSRQSNP